MNDGYRLLFFREEDGPPNFTVWIRDCHSLLFSSPPDYYFSHWSRWNVKGKWWMPVVDACAMPFSSTPGNAEWVLEETYTRSGSEIQVIETFELVGHGSPKDRHPGTNAMMA